jgi:hypothetical protein
MSRETSPRSFRTREDSQGISIICKGSNIDMDVLSPEVVNFLGSNILLIGIVLLLFFAYMVLLIRKRWKQNFLHPDATKEKKK